MSTVNAPDPSETRNQYIAVLLIFLALVAVAMADHWNWRDLANAGQTVLGFGGGILMGKSAAQYLSGKSNASDLPPGGVATSTTKETIQVPPITEPQ